MRSWRIFIVVGILLLAVVIFKLMDDQATKKNPLMVKAEQFIAAVNNNDAAAAEQILDPEHSRLLGDGNHIINIWFSDTQAVIPSAFAKQMQLTWAYSELTKMKLDPDAKPGFINDIGKAPLTGGRFIYFRRVGNDWKIFYITKLPVNGAPMIR